jgi:hypothetical protein
LSEPKRILGDFFDVNPKSFIFSQCDKGGRGVGAPRSLFLIPEKSNPFFASLEGRRAGQRSEAIYGAFFRIVIFSGRATAN